MGGMLWWFGGDGGGEGEFVGGGGMWGIVGGWGNQGYLMSFPHKHNCGKQLVYPRSCTGYALPTRHMALYHALSYL